MPLLFSSEVASTHPALVAVDMGILQLPQLRLPRGNKSRTNATTLGQFRARLWLFLVVQQKNLWIFFLLKNAVELINSHDIVFLQSYANFQEVNLDGKSREKNTKSMPLGFRPLYKCSHLILTHVACRFFETVQASQVLRSVKKLPQTRKITIF